MLVQTETLQDLIVNKSVGNCILAAVYTDAILLSLL